MRRSPDTSGGRGAGNPAGARTLALLAGLALVASGAGTAVAGDGFEVSAGAGVVVENVYLGSDASYVGPLVSCRVEYATGPLSCFASLEEGAGLTYVGPAGRWFATVAINQGDERRCADYEVAGFRVEHDEATRALLEGTPDLANGSATTLAVGLSAPLGIVAGSVSYRPTSVSFGRPGVADADGAGFLYSLAYLVQRPLGRRLAVAGQVQLTAMDAAYADAWFSVPHATRALDVFAARAGLRDLQVALQVGYAVSPRVQVSCLGAGTVLLQDARRSPFTTDAYQRTLALQTIYRF